jgi:hypothetical protein
MIQGICSPILEENEKDQINEYAYSGSILAKMFLSLHLAILEF